MSCTLRAKSAPSAAFYQEQPGRYPRATRGVRRRRRADADAALEAAAGAWPSWKRTPIAERAQLLRRVAQLIEERVYDIAAVLTLEVGKNRMEALGEAQEAADFFTPTARISSAHGGFRARAAGRSAHELRLAQPQRAQALRAVGRDHPFNFPLALAAGPIAAALITGNTVVAKGATATPWAGRLLADCIRDAGLPPGVFNYLCGPGAVIGAALVDPIRSRRGSPSPAPMRSAWRSPRTAGAALSAALHRGDGRQERLHRDRGGRS